MHASILRSLVAVCLMGSAFAAVTAGDASGQYELASSSARVAEALPELTPFPVVRIRGVATGRGARIDSLTVRAEVGVIIVSRCFGPAKRCPYRRSTLEIEGAQGTLRTVHLDGFERDLRAGVRLRLFVVSADRLGKYTSFRIRRRVQPRRRDRCVRELELTPIPCPG